MKERIKNTLKNRYPDKEFDTDEELEAGYNDFENEFNTTKAGYDELMAGGTKLADAIKADPTIGEILNSIMQGTPLIVAIIETLGEDALKAEMDIEGVEDARTKYAEKNKAREARMSELESNGVESSKVLSDFNRATFKGDKERETEFVDWVSSSLQNILDNKISKEILTKLYKGFVYEEDIDAAKNQATIDANAKKIGEKRETTRAGIGASAAADTTPKKQMGMGNNKPFRI